MTTHVCTIKKGKAADCDSVRLISLTMQSKAGQESKFTVTETSLAGILSGEQGVCSTRDVRQGVLDTGWWSVW